MRNRQKQQELKKREERLDTRNAYGNRDLTPYNAVARIKGETKLLLK
jgi:hypothetical protein